jgi:hypothetical protein
MFLKKNAMVLSSFITKWGVSKTPCCIHTIVGGAQFTMETFEKKENYNMAQLLHLISWNQK